jgi:hypothetical protein
VALEDPGPVVRVLEGVERLAQLLDGLESADPEEVFLERPDEALGAAVALGLTDEGGRGLDAEEGELALEVVGDELASVTGPRASIPFGTHPIVGVLLLSAVGAVAAA